MLLNLPEHSCTSEEAPLLVLTLFSMKRVMLTYISIIGHVQPSVILYQDLTSKEPKTHLKLNKSLSSFPSVGPNYL